MDDWVEEEDKTFVLVLTLTSLSATGFVPSAASIVAAANNDVNVNTSTNVLSSSSTQSSISSTSTMVNNNSENESQQGIANFINKLSCEKISKNEEIQYLKSLLKSYNGKHIYINENVIKRQIIEKTIPSTSQSIPASIDDVPVIPINVKSTKAKVNLKTKSKSGISKDLTDKRMMIEKYLNDEKQQHDEKIENTIVISDNELEIGINKNNNYYYNKDNNNDNDNSDENDKSKNKKGGVDDVDDDLLKNIGKSIDLSIIEDLNIFNEKHYQEKILNKHQEYTKSHNIKDLHEDDTFSENSPTLVN